ncbi:MAG: tRNA (adenosine(37)-N6)-threonylcarbamoyltransferase complex ATPase subunit type 1 TsaE, partial [Thermomonas sp.]
DAGEIRLWLIEWPERGQGALPHPDLKIELEVESTGRRCRLRPASSIGEAWVAALSKERGLRDVVANPE